MLSAERRSQLDSIVVQMAEQDAPQEDVQAIVDDFTQKYGQEDTTASGGGFFSNAAKTAAKTVAGAVFPAATTAISALEIGGKAMKEGGTGEPADIPFVPDTFIQGAAKPFARLGTNLIAASRAGNQEAYDDIVENGYNSAYFGNLKPVGVMNKQADSYGDVAKNIGKGLLDSFGVGAEVYSFGATPLKGAMLAGKTGAVSTALQRTIDKPFLGKVVQSLPFAAPFGIGMGAQKAAEDDASALEVVSATLGGALGAAAGFGVLTKGGEYLGRFGGKMMRSAAARAMAEKVSSLANDAASYVKDASKQKLADKLSFSRAALRKETEDSLHALQGEALNIQREEVPEPAQVMASLTKSLRESEKKAFEGKDVLYANVLDSGEKVTEKSPVTTAISKARTAFNQLADSLVGDEQSGKDLNRLHAFIRFVEDSPTSIRDAYRRFTSFSSYLGANNEVNNQIRDVAFAQIDAITASLEKNAPHLLPEWNRASAEHKRIMNNVTSAFSSMVKGASGFNDIRDAVVLGVKPSAGQVQHLLDAFTHSNDRAVFSQGLYNSVMDKAMVAKTPGERQAVLESALKWFTENTAEDGSRLLSDRHMAGLETSAGLMETKHISDIAGVLQQVKGGGMTPAIQEYLGKVKDFDFIQRTYQATDGYRDTSKIGNAFANITSTDEMRALLSLIKDDQESVNTLGLEIYRGIVERNTREFVQSGKEFNEEAVKKMVSGILSEFDKFGGENGRELSKMLFGKVKTPYGSSLQEHITTFDDALRAIDTLNLRTTNGILKAGHLITGLLYGATSRPVPAIYHLSQGLRQSETLEKAVPLSEEQIRGLMSDYFAKGEARKSNAVRQLGVGLREATEKFAFPSIIAGQPEAKLIEAMTDMLGREPTDDEIEQLRSGQ